MKNKSVPFVLASFLLFLIPSVASADGLVCTMQYAPVCGVDGQSYGNRCMAGKVDIAHEGVCLQKASDCQIRCLRYDPVCGENGKTYGCGRPEAECYGVKVIGKGACDNAANSCALSDKVSRERCATFQEKQIFEKYLKSNIGKLSQAKAVLGGKFFVTNILWKANRVAIVNYEDGHIALKAETQMIPLKKTGKL